MKKLLGMILLTMGIAIKAAQPIELTPQERKQTYPYAIKGEWNKVANILTGMIKKNPKKAIYWNMRAVAYGCSRNFRKSINDLTQALLLCQDPSDKEMRGNLLLARAGTHYELGNIWQAYIDAASAIGTGNPNAENIMNGYYAIYLLNK